ncbi:MAG: hypothetical protein JNL30_11005 [Rubrivivax sp.]|nr:hypothetical protein [Rubrivivax sp.]
MKPADNDMTLAAALLALREDLARQAPPAALWSAIRQSARPAARSAPPVAPEAAAAATAARARSAPAAPWAGLVPGLQLPRWPAWAGAAACTAVIVLSLLLTLRVPREHLPEQVADLTARATRAPQGAAGRWPQHAERLDGSGWTPVGHFVPLVSTERLRALAGTAAPGAPAGTAGASPPATAAWVLTTEMPQQHLASLGLPYDPGRAAEPLRAELLVSGSGEVLAVRLQF